MADQLPVASPVPVPEPQAPVAGPAPAGTPIPAPGGSPVSTNTSPIPYVPANIQTGLATVPLAMQADTDTRLARIFNPTLTQKDAPTTQFHDFFNTQKQEQGKVPQVSLKDAFFSGDQKLQAAADNVMESQKDGIQRAQVGNSINTPYDQASKYLGKEFGFTALTDNEDLYANYKNAGVSGVVENAGKFITRTVGSAILKLGEGVSGLLAMPLAAVQDGHFWSNVSDNALVQLFDNAEKGFKDNWFPVYQAAAERNDGFFGRMFHDSTFWTSDFSDGLGFMLSAMLPGTALSKVGLAAKLGDAAEILNYGRLGKLGQAIRYASGEAALTARGVDALATTTLNTASEAFFEAKGVHDSVVQKYSDMLTSNPDQMVNLPDGTRKRAGSLSKDEIEGIASHGARNDFAANFPILMFSNAFETNLLYKALGKNPIKIKGVSLAEDLTAQVEKPTSKIGQLINGRLGFYTKKSVEAAWWEGLWEENAQLAAQRLNDDSVDYDRNDPAIVAFGKQIYKQTKDAFSGKDQEAASSIGQGILMGVLAGNVLSAAGKEYSKEKQEAIHAAANLNNLRDRFLTGDIYQKDGQGNYTHDASGKMQVDENKLNAQAIRTNQMADKAKRIQDFKDPDIRNMESKLAFVDYFHAAVLAGKDEDVLQRLNDLKNKSPEALVQMGFDPQQKLGAPESYMSLGNRLQGIHEETEATPMGTRPREVSPQVFSAVNLARRSQIIKSRAAAEIYGDMADEASTNMHTTATRFQTEDNSSLTDYAVTEANLLNYRMASNDETIDDPKTSTKIRTNLKEINIRLQEELNEHIKDNDMHGLPRDKGGYFNYENTQLSKNVWSSGMFNYLSKAGGLQNLRDAQNLEASKIANSEFGFHYFAKDLENQTKNVTTQPTVQTTPTSNQGNGQTTGAGQQTRVPVTPATQQPAATATPVATAAPVSQTTPNTATPTNNAGAEEAEVVPETPPDTSTFGQLDLTNKGYQYTKNDNGKGTVLYAVYGPNKSTGDIEYKDSYESETDAQDHVDRENQVLSDEAKFAPTPQELAQQSTPLIQDQETVTQDNADHLQDIQQQLEEENGEEGKKIVNSLSIASKAVDYDFDSGVAPKNELGRPIFNSEQNNIIDFGKIVPGTKVFIREEPGSSLNPQDVPIRIYLKENGKEVLLGYMHTPKGLKRLLARTDDFEAQWEKLIRARATILASSGQEWEADVTQTGFGFANKGDNRGYKTVDDATEKDSKVVLAIKQSGTFIGEGGQVQATRFGINIKEGATVLMLPNNVNGQNVMIPVYVTKKSVSTDEKIKNVVSSGIQEYLSTGDKKALNAARDYIYITSSGAVALGLTNNGLFLNDQGQLIFRNKNIADMQMDTLLSQLLVNINSSKLNDKGYVNQMRNSPAIQTAFFARTEGNDKSYFHQHTIQYSDPINKTQSNGKVNQRNENVQQKQSVQQQAQNNASTQGVAQQQAASNELQQQKGQVTQTGQRVSPADLIRQEDTRSLQSKIEEIEKKRAAELSEIKDTPPLEDLLKEGNVINYNGRKATVVKTDREHRRGDRGNAFRFSDGEMEHTLLPTYGPFNDKTRAALDHLRSQNGQYEVWKSRNEINDKYDAEIKKLNELEKASDLDRAIRELAQSERDAAAKSSETEEEKIQRLNQELLDDLENDGFVMDDVPDVHYDLSDTAVENIGKQDSTLLVPGFNAFIQEDAVNSMSQILLSNEEDNKGLADVLFGDVADNKARAQKVIEQKVAEYNEKVEKYAPLIAAGTPAALRIQQGANNLKLVADNFDAIHAQATERLSKIGLVADEQGYYQPVEDEATNFTDFDDDSEYQKNHYESISRLVKQFISFNSEKIEVNGKTGNRINSLGLPTVVQPTVVYTKTMNWLSEHYFSPTWEGFLNMIDKLGEIPDPTIKDIASRLRNSENTQLKFQFFTNMSKFKTNHTQQLTTIDRTGVRARNIDASTNQLVKVVFRQMSDEFIQNSKVLIKSLDEYGNNNYRVDKKAAEPYVLAFIELNNKNSYYIRKDQDGQPTGSKGLKEEAAQKMHAILQDLGFGMSQKGFIRAITAINGSNPKGDAQIGIVDLFTGGNKILRKMIEGEDVSQDRDLHNPFIANTTEMNVIARAESNFRTINQTDSFRSNGKSYYPFTRMSFVKSIFQQINQYAETGKITPLLQTFTWDPFKGASRFLAQARIDPKFSPSLEFARGTKETGSKSTNQEVKDQNDKDFVISKIHAFQNSGNADALFFSDTYSDKTTRFQIKSAKEDIGITFNGDSKTIDTQTLSKFYGYFLGELGRVNKIREQNQSLPMEQRISGLHDTTKEGIGKHFVVFNFLNADELDDKISSVIYDDDGSVKDKDPAAQSAILNTIEANLVKLIDRYQVKLERYGMFTDPTTGLYSPKGISDSQYYGKVAAKMDDHWNPKQEAFYITADYVLNASLNSLEMLTLTGDPAQSPKVKTDAKGRIRLSQSIKATLTEVSKRNASLNAPFDQGINVRPEYKVGFVQDLKINSEQLEEYKKLLPSQADAVEKGYKNGEMTDAQEFTTVKEQLTNLLSMGRISPVEFIEGFAHFDPEHFDDSRKELATMIQQLGINYTLNGEKIREQTAKKDMTGLLQVIKPVQRYSRWDENLGMVVETYIKTSAFPLVPALVKGKDFEGILAQMQAQNIDRLNFASGTKQGLINPQSLYNSEGGVNPTIFTNNVITLPAAAWGEQVENPEKEALKVTEGSQQQRMIFVDLPDEAILTYKGQEITGKNLRDKYVSDHNIIFQSKLKNLFEELGVNSENGINSFSSLSKLSEILRKEGAGRDYDRNTLLALNLDKSGQFEIPLTFLPNASEIQALLAAVVSNRILKNKLPGTSLIQGSEAVIKTNGKVKVSEDITQAPKGSIVWTKPEYANISKLKYIREENGEVKPAQIVLPFYFKTKEGKSVPLSSFVNSQGFLDSSKIDASLLEINGFRIPYAGPNSGMWFEVVGYLPETMGSLVIVPAEVAAQMGADYDVDKLFTYLLNHKVDAKGIREDNSTAQKAAENDIILAHKAVYLNKDRLAKTIEPTSTDELDRAVERLPKPSGELTQMFDPEHQDNIWLSNRAGQLGVGISANFNTFHSLAQQSNLFTKGAGIKFLDAEGKIYNETNNAGDFMGINGKVNDGLYIYGDQDDLSNALTDFGVNRLDRMNTFPNPYTGESRPIASVVNNWLQASVDNAKLQLLGLGGINKFNFNAALTIALHGFDSDWIIPFINQPIIKEYTEAIQGVNDKFNKDFSATKVQDSIDKLFNKYLAKLDAADRDKYDFDGFTGLSHDELVKGVPVAFDTMGAAEASGQLNVLKQFLNLDKIGQGISGISTDTKVEVNGLSKSFAEINQQASDIDNLEDSPIGGLNRLRTDTVSGVYLNVPGMISDLFNHPDNPIFAYSTPTYQKLRSDIEALTGRNLNAEQQDDVYKEFKQFIYTHPSLGLSSADNSIGSIKDNLLVQGNLAKSWQDMKAKYPNSILLNQLSQKSKIRDNDPDILTMQSAADDIATQIKQEWLDFFKSKDPALLTFANQLTTYALLFGSKEYGPSNMIKFIPFEVLKGIGFGERLNEINRNLVNSSLYKNFIRQYIQHNQEQVKFVSNKSLPKLRLMQMGADGKATNIPAQFTFEDPILDYLDKNNLRQIATTSPDGNAYRTYIRTFINDTIGHTLYELQQDGRTYRRIDTLGNQYINEYDFTNSDVKTIFPLKQALQTSDKVDTTPPSPEDNPNPTVDDITTTYAKAMSVSDVLDTIQLRTGTATDATSQLYYELAKALVAGPEYSIEFAPDGKVRGSTWHDDQKIVIYPDTIKGVAQRLNIPYEQALQQTILHEIVHSRIDKYMDSQEELPASHQSPEYKQLEKVYNMYRKDLIEGGSSTFVRGIQDTFLEAELYKALYSRSVANTRGANHEATLGTLIKDWDTIKQNPQEIISVIHDMQRSMEAAHKEQGIGKNANFNLVSKTNEGFKAVDIERVAQIVEYLDRNFVNENLARFKEKYYAYTSPYEFNTMAMTSPGFMTHLNSVQGSGEKQSLWDRFKQIIKRIVSSFNNTSLLNDTIDAVLNINKAATTENVQPKSNKSPLVNIAITPTVEERQATPLISSKSEVRSQWNNMSNAEKQQIAQSAGMSLEDAQFKIDNSMILPALLEEIERELREAFEEDSLPQSTATPVVAKTDSQQPNQFTFSDGISVPTDHLNLNTQQKGALQSMADLVEQVKAGKNIDKLFILSGYAGTGKSSSVKFLVKYLNKKYNGSLSFKLATPTHKANKVLGRFFRGTIDEKPVTTKSLLGYKSERDPATNKFIFVLDEDKNKIPYKGILIIDEASFIGQKEYQDVLAAAAQKSATVIFMGDIAQIPSPDGSNRVSPAFGLKQGAQLTQVMRQADGNPLAPIYDSVRNNLMTDSFAKLFPHKTNLNNKGEGIEFISGDYQQTGKLLAAAIPLFTSAEFKADKMTAKMVAYGNPTVEMYNRSIRQALLANPEDEFQVGELLMGYEQKQLSGPVQNGQDYVITSRTYNAKKYFDNTTDISGYQLEIAEADEMTAKGNTFVLNPKDLNNQPFIQKYVNLLEQLKNVRGADYYEVLKKIEKIEGAALIPETIYSYQDKAYTNSMLRTNFPQLFKMDEKTNQRPIDKMLSIAKNIDYGYAVTAHKVQGSTYKNVFIDENNLEFDKRIIKTADGSKDFSYERNNLLYVALSRPTTKATVLSRHTITEDNTHEAGQQEQNNTRSITQALAQPTQSTSGPVLNVSAIAADRILKGTKTMLNVSNLIEEGTYSLKDGSKVQVRYEGEIIAQQSDRRVYTAPDPNSEDATSVTFDEYAKKEGFKNWADYQQNAPSASGFINDEELRYGYSVKALANNKASDIIDTLTKDGSLTKKDC